MTTTRARPRTRPDTATRVLDVAEGLVQKRGFNGFSYADVAAELGITTASLHYHFPGKAELGSALIARYSARFAEALGKIDARATNAPGKLESFAELYEEVLRRRRMCLCGMLAAEFDTLPKAMRDAVVRFFDDNEAWLTGVLDQGREAGSLHFEGPPGEMARMIISGLEGAMLVARPYGDVARFHLSAKRLLSTLSAGATPV